MKYTLSISSKGYVKEEKTKLERLGLKFEMSWCEDIYYNIDRKPIIIEIKTLKELMQFVKDYGTIVVGLDYIRIYDRWS